MLSLSHKSEELAYLVPAPERVPGYVDDGSEAAEAVMEDVLTPPSVLVPMRSNFRPHILAHSAQDVSTENDDVTLTSLSFGHFFYIFLY